MVAALYVDPRGPYADVPGIDLWDVTRDARRYTLPAALSGGFPPSEWPPVVSRDPGGYTPSPVTAFW